MIIIIIILKFRCEAHEKYCLAGGENPSKLAKPQKTP